MTSLQENYMDVETRAKLIDEIIDQILDTYSNELDEYIGKVHKRWIIENQQPTDEELNDVTARVPLYLYYASEILQKIGSREDLAKLMKNDKFNETLLASTGTVVEKNAKADVSSTENQIIHIAYSGAYKRYQQKYNIALELLNSAKKLQNVRMQDKELSRGIK